MTMAARPSVDWIAVPDPRAQAAGRDDVIDTMRGIAILTGNLAPLGAALKPSAATPALMKHRGPAVVFEDIHDYDRRIDDPALEVTPD